MGAMYNEILTVPQLLKTKFVTTLQFYVCICEYAYICLYIYINV